MLIELICGSGIIYIGGETYKKRQRQKKPLADFLKTNENPEMKGEIPLSSIYDEMKAAVQKIKQDTMAPLRRLRSAQALSNVRHQQIMDISSTKGDIHVNELEEKARRNLVLSSGSLALAVAGLLVSPLLFLASAVSIIYLSKVVFQAAYRSLTQDRRVDLYVLYAAIITGSLLGGLILAAAIAIWFAMVNEFLVVKTEDHSKQGLVNLFGEQPRSVWVLVDGVEVEQPFEHVEVGDTIVLNAGQSIPIDGTIIMGMASIDQHMLTGEAQPAEKSVGDSVYAATIMLSGKIHVRIEEAGQETVAAQIGEILNQTTDYRLVVQRRWEGYIERLIPPMLALSIVTLPFAGLSGALAVLWYYPGYRMVVFGPLSMLSFLHVAARNGILVKDGRSLESLSAVDTVVFDKTGTLTLEQPHIGQIYRCNGLSEEELLVYAAAAEHHQTHPIARAILAAAVERQLSLPLIDDAHYEVGYGIKVRLGNQTVRVGSARFMVMEEIAIPADIAARQAECHVHGHSLVLVALDNELAGALELCPTIRPEAKEIIDQLHQRNLELVIISGDNDAPTQRLAEELGIDRYFAEVLPKDKAALVKQLQEAGRSVCFVGDGINDAIALKTADVSVSLRGATTVAVDTAQIVLMDGSIRQLGYLFKVIDDFDSNMRFNFVASVAPSLFGIAATFLFGWGFLAAAIIVQSTTPVALYNTLRPLLNQPPTDEDGNLPTDKLLHPTNV
ncbi:MAG: heavy metal translocating P-type ATPase [Caldilineaceae bacterium]